MVNLNDNANTLGMEKVRVGICGASGRMGKEVVRAILEQPDLALVMAVDTNNVGTDVALNAERLEPCGTLIESDLEAAITRTRPQVIVDFTNPNAVFDNVMLCIQHNIYCVVGTTGLTPFQLGKIESALKQSKAATLIAPNFAIGAVLLMKFAQEASQYFEHAEIIELHHNQKMDSPSGTAFRTAELMKQTRSRFGTTNLDPASEKEILPGTRGGTTEANIHIHSVRLPGLVAHEEVIFGGVGQTLTLRHDSLDRTSFMPGVVLAVRKIRYRQGLVYGLENLL